MVNKAAARLQLVPTVAATVSIAPVSISISHSHGIAFCTATHKTISVGCDIEKIEPRNRNFIDDYFTEYERLSVNSFDHIDAVLFPNLVWSAKESMVKLLRTGLSIDTRMVELQSAVINPDRDWNRLQMKKVDSGTFYSGIWREINGFVFVVMADTDSFEIRQARG